MRKGHTAPIPSSPFLGHLSIATAGILLGLIPLFKNFLTTSCNCTEIVTIRIVIAFFGSTIAMIATFAFGKNGGRFFIAKNDMKYFWGYGAICITAVYYFYIRSLFFTTAAVAVTAVFVAAPLTTLIVSTWRKMESFQTKKVSCILFMILGCILVSYSPVGSGNRSHLLGIFFGVMAGACYGLFSIFGKNLATKYNHTVMTFWQFAIALVCMLGLSLIMNGHEPFRLSVLTQMGKEEIYAALGLGVISTFSPYALYSYGLKLEVKASVASALTILETASCTIVAYLFLKETITLVQLTGISIIILFSTILSLKYSD